MNVNEHWQGYRCSLPRYRCLEQKNQEAKWRDIVLLSFRRGLGPKCGGRYEGTQVMRTIRTALDSHVNRGSPPVLIISPPSTHHFPTYSIGYSRQSLNGRHFDSVFFPLLPARTMVASPTIEKDQISETQLEKATDDYDFGGESQLPPPPILTEAEERQLYKKIDLRLMPILCVMYLMSFLDRGKLRAASASSLARWLWKSVGNIGNSSRLLGVCRLLIDHKGNARLQGLESQLNLVGNQYNIALVRTESCPCFDALLKNPNRRCTLL